MSDAKDQNVLLQWSRGNVDENIKALEKDFGAAFKAVAKSAQQNVLQVADSREAAYSQHWERITEKAGWTKAQTANDL